MQTPPMVSALKHEGTRLYKLARQGKTVPRQERAVTVHEFRLDKKDGRFINFFAHVSKGTYLRTLVNDLGDALGCHAALASLRRLRSGKFELGQSVTIEDLKRFTPEEFRAKVLPLSVSLAYENCHKPAPV